MQVTDLRVKGSSVAASGVDNPNQQPMQQIKLIQVSDPEAAAAFVEVKNTYKQSSEISKIMQISD